MFTLPNYYSWLDWNEVPTPLLIIAICFLGAILFQQKHDSKSNSIAKKSQLKSNFQPMPSPPTMPIIGHIHLLRDHQHNPWDGFDEIRKQFGDVVSLKMGIHPMVLVSSSEIMREILLKKGDIFSDRPNFARHHIIFGGDKENSLALCNWSNTHRDRRKLCKRGIVPNRFSSRNQLLETIISKEVVKFVDSISNQEKIYKHQQPILASNNNQTTTIYNQQLDANLTKKYNHDKFYHKITKDNILFLTSDIFMDFLCSESHSHSNEEYKEFIYGCDFVFWDINQSYLIDFLPFLTSLGLGFTYLKKLKRVTDFLRNYIDDKIFEPRRIKHLKFCDEQQQQQNSSIIFHETPMFNYNDVDDTNTSSGNNDYLDSLILEHLAKVTSMSLPDYKVGFADLLAGHAAVANILTRLLGHLALDQEIQDMICEEANQTDIYSLDYKPLLPITEAAMQEALRIASSPIVPHVAREDTSVDKFFVPTGTMVLFNIHNLNLSENLWSNPYKFDPTRFLKTCDNGLGGVTYKLDIPKHFMPFSVGMRQCLGHKMVETTTIVAVANLCRKFIIKADNEDLVRRLLTPKGSIALDPDSECFKLELYPR